MLSSLLELPEEDVGVAEVTVGSSLSAPVSELLGNLQSLLMVVNGLGEVSQQVVDISKISAGSPLGCSVLESKIELVK